MQGYCKCYIKDNWDGSIIQRFQEASINRTDIFPFLCNKKENLKWVPWTFQLCGTVETNYSIGNKFNVYPDVKLGVRFFSTAPAGIKFLTIGFNVFIGIRSAGLSMSYSLPKPLKNTSIHVYVGVAYTAKVAYGLGISLNF